MRTQRVPRHLDAATAERLLAGEPVAGHARLTGLLAAAAAPARPGELPGEESAVLAFRQAHLARSPVTAFPRRPAARRSTLTTILTVKIAAVVVAIGGIGGVTVAASTGHLPDYSGRGNQPGTGSVSVSSDDPSQPAAAPHARPGPSDQLSTLCRRYLKLDRDRRRTALVRDRSFKELTRRAGSRDPGKVDRFCTDLVPQGRAPGTVPSGDPDRKDLPHGSGWPPTATQPGTAPSSQSPSPDPSPAQQTGGPQVVRPSGPSPDRSAEPPSGSPDSSSTPR